jgi:ribosomal-protein-alanine N-acetyltransferase
VNITFFTSDDLPSVARFNTPTEVSDWTSQKLQSCLEHADYLAWKLSIFDQMVAYILINIAGDEAHIMHLAVDPEHRRKGYGAYLLKNTLQEMAKLYKQAVILEVNENNRAAIALYEKIGFQQIGQRKNYYVTADNKSETALVYEYCSRHCEER